jgi:hypothetical protein
MAFMPAVAMTASPPRPVLELSGPKLALAFETLIAGADEQGGAERYVAAVQLRSKLFRDAIDAARYGDIELATVKTLCAHMATVRRRIGPYLEPSRFEHLQQGIARLLERREDTSSADRRIAGFCSGFPDDREHRWARDFAAEVLHNLDPERYPLMTRWVWDARANTGVIREIWHGHDVDGIVIEVPDGYETFIVLREELSQFLTANGVFRDVLDYVDVLTAQIYANYIREQGSSYLRADFATPEDPMQHTRRLLGLDGVTADGRTRVKAVDGQAFVADDAGPD